MTYQAIARRCRPQRFEEVVGQPHVTQTLQNAIRLGRIHHAFLFCGTRGVGKTTAARILAKALNCENGPAVNPCNECENCLEITRGGHPDVTEIDGASNNRVDDIRDLIETVRYMPSKSKYRIYIIDEVHMVTQQAFNALLKTLEEPPEHVIFVFATTEPQKIPETVLSRCQRFDFKMLRQRTIYERLHQICEQEGLDIPESVLMPIAREAAGSMRDGQSLLDQVLSFADGPITADRAAEILGLVDRKLLHELLRAVVDGESDVVLRTYAEITQFGVDSRSLANELLTLLRHATVATLLEDTARLIDLPIEETEALGALAREAGVEAVQRRFDILSSATDEIARSDTPDLVLEMALIRMSRVRPFVPVDTLVERLLELERRLMSGRVGARSAPASRSAPAPRPAPEPRPARTATRPPPIAKEPAPPKVVEPPPPKAEVAPSPKVEEPPPPKAEVPPPPKAEVPPPPKAEVPPPPKAEVPPPIEEPSPPVEEPPAPVEPGAARDATGWAAFVESVSGSTAAILGEGRFRRADGEELILGFPKPSVHQMAVKKLASPRGQKALTAFFGPGVRVVCEEVSEDDAGPLSPGEQARADTAARRKAREERARAHPAVDKIQAQFPGAKVGRIRHLED